eukprot:gene752-4044_t
MADPNVLHHAFRFVSDKAASDCHDVFTIDQAKEILYLLERNSGMDVLLLGHAKKLKKIARLCIKESSDQELISAIVASDAVNISGGTQNHRHQYRGFEDGFEQEDRKVRSCSEVCHHLKVTAGASSLHDALSVRFNNQQITMEEIVACLQSVPPTLIECALQSTAKIAKGFANCQRPCARKKHPVTTSQCIIYKHFRFTGVPIRVNITEPTTRCEQGCLQIPTHQLPCRQPGCRRAVHFLLMPQSRLHSAAWTGDIDALNTFIDKGLDVNVQHPTTKVTPLHYAARRGHVEISRTLIAHGANPAVFSKDGMLPYDIARKHHNSDVADFLEKIRKCILHLLPHEKDTALVNEIIEHADNLDSRRYIGVTPLHISCAIGNCEFTRLLLTRGASTKYKDTRKRTCLHYAVIHGHKDTVSLLLAVGMKTTSQDDTGRTAIEYARDMYPEISRIFENPPEKISLSEGGLAQSRRASTANLLGSNPTSPASPHLHQLEHMSQSSGSSISLLYSPERDEGTEADELREFLDDLDLVDKAYHILVANEITDMETLRLMSKADMISIGIKMGVALKIVGNL